MEKEVKDVKLAVSSEEDVDRILECPICFEKMNNINFLATAPDKYDHRYTVCNHGYCPSCVDRIIKKADNDGRPARCCLCSRQILGVISNNLVERLVVEWDKLKTKEKDWEKLKDIIRQFNLQKTVLKDELLQIKEKLESKEKKITELTDGLKENEVIIEKYKNKYEKKQKK